MSRYTRFAPMPIVSVVCGERKREGMVEIFLGGNAGFIGGVVRPMVSGTVRSIRSHSEKLERTTRTFLPARVVTSSYLPLPYPLEILSPVDERGRL